MRRGMQAYRKCFWKSAPTPRVGARRQLLKDVLPVQMVHTPYLAHRGQSNIPLKKLQIKGLQSNPRYN